MIKIKKNYHNYKRVFSDYLVFKKGIIHSKFCNFAGAKSIFSIINFEMANEFGDNCTTSYWQAEITLCRVEDKRKIFENWH